MRVLVKLELYLLWDGMHIIIKERYLNCAFLEKYKHLNQGELCGLQLQPESLILPLYAPYSISTISNRNWVKQDYILKSPRIYGIEILEKGNQYKLFNVWLMSAITAVKQYNFYSFLIKLFIMICVSQFLNISLSSSLSENSLQTCTCIIVYFIIYIIFIQCILYKSITQLLSLPLCKIQRLSISVPHNISVSTLFS